MKNLISVIYPMADFLYLLQLEEYETKRYFNIIKRFWWRRNIQKRGKLVYTSRIKVTYILALPFSVVMPPFIPLWIGLSNLLFSSYFESLKLNIQKKAAEYFKYKNKNTKVIAIAGSYGKTTTKNYIYELVKYNYKTQVIPGNINTPTGIANWILENFDSASEILILEVDTYFVGEIRRSLNIVPPDIAILTNIADQHLERFGKRKNLKAALLEIFRYAKKGAIRISERSTNLEYALEVSKILQIPKDIVADTVAKLQKPDRRGDIKIINKLEVVDESYNISTSTVKIVVKNALVTAKEKGKKLIVITAGIPELGEENREGNKDLGTFLSHNVEKIILLKSVFYEEVLNDSDKFILTDDLQKAWKILETYDPEKYLVLLLPELNDLYY